MTRLDVLLGIPAQLAGWWPALVVGGIYLAWVRIKQHKQPAPIDPVSEDWHNELATWVADEDARWAAITDAANSVRIPRQREGGEIG